MKKSTVRLFLIALVFSALVLALSSPVHAGGWVVITLDRLPSQVNAGQPYELGFMARQHGQTPWQVAEIRIEARQSQTGQRVTFSATPDQPQGHYHVQLLFPQPGRWEWGLQSGLFPTTQPMPAIEVGGLAQASTAPATPGLLRSLMGGLALVALASAALLLIRYRGKIIFRWVGLGMFVLGGFCLLAFFTFGNAQAEPIPQAQAAAAAPETGKQLFMAKGCVVCHVNSRAVENPDSLSVNIGPNLSIYRKDPAFLRTFLANPTGPETTFKMPNLGLAPAEIEALVEFLNN